MGYTPWSVTAGEQPTTTKWNLLGSNDASFADGTGIGQGAITAANLSTGAITLGYTPITTNFSTSSTTFVQITGLSVSVTIPAGGRKIKITAFAEDVGIGAAGTWAMSIWDGTVGTGTQLAATRGTVSTNNVAPAMCVAIVTPSAGSKTYNVGLNTSTNTATLDASSVAPAFIMVEAV